MGVLGVFIGCRGDGGFNGRCSGASIGDGGFMLACISGCRGVIGFKVAMSRVLCAKKFALLGPVRMRARKSSPCVLRKAHNRLFMACWAIFSRQCRSRGCVGRILSRCRPDASHVGRTLSRRWRCWHAMRLYVGLARRAANRPQPGRSRLGVIAANEPPAHASCGGGRQYEDSSSNTQRNRCKRR